MSWSARLLIALVLILLGAAAATWGLARYQPAAARLLGVDAADGRIAPARPQLVAVPQPVAARAARRRSAASPSSSPAGARRECRHARRKARPAAPMRWSSPSPRAGRSIAASRSAISSRCWSTASAPGTPSAVATIVTGSRPPVRLDELVAEYETLGRELLGAGPDEGSWSGSSASLARWSRSAARTALDAARSALRARRSAGFAPAKSMPALAETMRLPGAPDAGPWVAKARRYIARPPRARRDRVRRAAAATNSRSEAAKGLGKANRGCEFCAAGGQRAVQAAPAKPLADQSRSGWGVERS